MNTDCVNIMLYSYKYFLNYFFRIYLNVRDVVQLILRRVIVLLCSALWSVSTVKCRIVVTSLNFKRFYLETFKLSVWGELIVNTLQKYLRNLNSNDHLKPHLIHFVSELIIDILMVISLVDISFRFDIHSSIKSHLSKKLYKDQSSNRYYSNFKINVQSLQKIHSKMFG